MQKRTKITNNIFFQISRSQLRLSSSNRSIYKQPKHVKIHKLKKSRQIAISFIHIVIWRKNFKVRISFILLLLFLFFSDSVTFTIDFLYHFLDLISWLRLWCIESQLTWKTLTVIEWEILLFNYFTQYFLPFFQFRISDFPDSRKWKIRKKKSRK